MCVYGVCVCVRMYRDVCRCSEAWMCVYVYGCVRALSMQGCVCACVRVDTDL